MGWQMDKPKCGYHLFFYESFVETGHWWFLHQEKLQRNIPTPLHSPSQFPYPRKESRVSTQITNHRREWGDPQRVPHLLQSPDNSTVRVRNPWTTQLPTRSGEHGKFFFWQSISVLKMQCFLYNKWEALHDAYSLPQKMKDLSFQIFYSNSSKL